MSVLHISRWVEAPTHVNGLDSRLLPPASGPPAWPPGSSRRGSTWASSPPTSRTPSPPPASPRTPASGAPVIVTEGGGWIACAPWRQFRVLERGRRRARGRDRARDAVGGRRGARSGAGQVAVASTGVIGIELLRERVVDGVRAACAALARRRGLLERHPHERRRPQARLPRGHAPGGTVRLAAQAKGAGMISPRHATMFCFVQTDAALDADNARPAHRRVREALLRPHQRGRAALDERHGRGARERRLGRTGGAESPDELALGEALDALLRQLALEIVHDGEGEARRPGRRDRRPDAVEPVARSVANSPLVKAALHGGDPNFGASSRPPARRGRPGSRSSWTSRSRATRSCPRATW